MKAIFFGTPHFAAEILKFLFQKKITIAAVVTQPDRPKGRSAKPIPSPVKQVAIEYNPEIPVYTPEKASAEESAALLAAHDADLFIVVAYGEIIKDNLLNMPKLACINIHASILPKYRGAAPIQRCIIEGEKESGVTIMHMAKKMDAGDVISIAKVPILENMTAGELETELCKISQPTLYQVIQDLEQGKALRTPQNHEEASFASKLSSQDGFVDWKQEARKIHDQIRGLTPRPGAWCKIKIKDRILRLKIHQTELKKEYSGKAGEIVKFSDGDFIVACDSGAIKINLLQLEGKKINDAQQFLSMYSNENISLILN